jgi:heat shock protein HslJ
LHGNIATVNNGKLSFGALGTTRMFCQDIPEADFLDALTRTTNYNRNQMKLELAEGNTVLLRFKKVD